MTEKEIVLAKNNLAKTKIWTEIKTYLFEEIKEKANHSNGDFIVGMLKAISTVDEWIADYNRLLESEEK